VSSIAAAAVTLWVGYAVVATATRTAPRPAVPAPTRHAVVPPRLALSAVPALRVRAALLGRAAATAPAVHVRHKRATRTKATRRKATRRKASAPASPAPQGAMSAPAAPPATPEPASAVQAPPAARPAPKPQPRVTATPKRRSPPDFDESAPSGFDNAG
jgi:ribonuclease E